MIHQLIKPHIKQDVEEIQRQMYQKALSPALEKTF